METGLIKDAQITASSQWDVNHAAIQGRLNFLAGGGKQGGWSARHNNPSQWIQIDLLTYTKVTRTATQGRNAFQQWVTKYKLQYSEDGLHFNYYRESGQSSPKVIRPISLYLPSPCPASLPYLYKSRKYLKTILVETQATYLYGSPPGSHRAKTVSYGNDYSWIEVG